MLEYLPLGLFLLAGGFGVWASIEQTRRDHPRELKDWRSSGMLAVIAGTLAVLALLAQSYNDRRQFKATLDSFTGGDSFVYLANPASREDMRTVRYLLYQYGDNTVYDISIHIYRAGESWVHLSETGNPDRKTNPSRRQFTSLAPVHSPIDYTDSVVAWDNQNRDAAPEAVRHIAVISTRNNFFTQYIRLDNVGPDEKWTQSFVLFEHDDPEKIVHRLGKFDEILEELHEHDAVPSHLTKPPRAAQNNAALLRRRR